MKTGENMSEEIRNAGQETRIRSIRCSDAVMDAIKKICDENGQTQAEALNQMLNAWEYVQSSAIPSLSDRQESINRFTSLTNSIQTMYLELLKDMADIKEKTAEEFRRRLDDKDERLFTAEEQLKKEKASAASSLEKYRQASDMAEEYVRKYRASVSELEEYKTMAEGRIHDKELLIASLRVKVDEVSGYEAFKEENRVLKAENASLKEEITKIRTELETVREDSRREKEHALMVQEAELTKKYLMELAEIQHRFGFGKGSEAV